MSNHDITGTQIADLQKRAYAVEQALTALRALVNQHARALTILTELAEGTHNVHPAP